MAIIKVPAAKILITFSILPFCENERISVSTNIKRLENRIIVIKYHPKCEKQFLKSANCGIINCSDAFMIGVDTI